ncbi:DUF567-domain-containing protein [Auricularia subglabra TFB-10046 SS5]|nr:DUF567-domain-containing protein [Auricularia subglabra TFB-10046 SS5]
MAYLPPSSAPLGIHPAYLARQLENIVLKEKVLSLGGDSFDVKTVDGRQLFKVKGEHFSLSHRKHVMDAQGNPLFDIRQHHFRLQKSFYGEDPAGNNIFEIKGHFSIGTSKSTCTFKSVNGQEVNLAMKGDWLDRKAEIKDEATGQVVALINREFFNMREMFAGQQTYVVSVAPNVDMAIIAAMCICLDERENEKND